MSNALCRYALVEIVNLHSPALEFEAIHRIVTDVDTKALMSEMTAALELSEEKAEQAIVVCDNGEEKTLYIHKPTHCRISLTAISRKRAARWTISTVQRS